jgi:hypothetical protein
MKKIVYLLVIITALASCGRDKKEEQTKQSESVVEKKADQYSVLIEAIYEKNDSISLVYQDGGFFQYEKAISSKITGQTGLQKIEIKIPENQQIENIKIVISTNKDQQTLDVRNISILQNGNPIIDGSISKYAQYFLTDSSFKWDATKSRYILDHSGKYPPTLVGNEKIIQML